MITNVCYFLEDGYIIVQIFISKTITVTSDSASRQITNGLRWLYMVSNKYHVNNTSAVVRMQNNMVHFVVII